MKRRRQARQWAQQQLEKADLLRVHSAVNAVQNTSYRIHRPVHRLTEKALNEGLPFFKLEKFKRKDQARARKAVLSASLSMAAGMLDEPRFYYPHQIDHRSRAYPVPQRVDPQRDDFSTAQLEFAIGKPLGENGPHWLAIHLANCYWKGEKVSFAKRRAWVTEHEREILAFASDPLREHRFWRDADKPWNFLRACLEWKGYREQGAGFVSHLPISMDGTCNGYQHLSAMGLDPVGGAATNLIPSEHPADIYLRVADRVNLRLEKDAGGSGPHAYAARQLIGLIDRDAVKPATMTLPYGVTRGTIYTQLLQSGLLKDCEDPKKAAKYLAKVLEECIREVAVEAGKIMGWASVTLPAFSQSITVAWFGPSRPDSL